jgi:hypothetical protein
MWPVTVPSSTFIAASRVVGAVPLVVVGHGSGAALLERQAGLGPVERLDLALFVDGKDDGVRRRIDVEPDDVVQLVDEGRVVGQLELPGPMGTVRNFVCGRGG